MRTTSTIAPTPTTTASAPIAIVTTRAVAVDLFSTRLLPQRYQAH